MDINVGRHCQYVECGKLDFLPFQCPYCKLYFCLDHRQWSQHECQTPPRENKYTRPTVKNSTKHKCCSKVCREKSSSMMKCTKCHQYVCLRHRYHDTHPCRQPSRIYCHNLHPPPKKTWYNRLFRKT
jgi:predicted nucleic acid binding AN1-type Zn finger protein